MALLGDIHTTVPTAPDCGGVEHASTPGLVSKSCLSSTVSSTTRSTWNTCHSSASAPRFSCSVIACFWASQHRPVSCSLPCWCDHHGQGLVAAGTATHRAWGPYLSSRRGSQSCRWRQPAWLSPCLRLVTLSVPGPSFPALRRNGFNIFLHSKHCADKSCSRYRAPPALQWKT